MNATEIAYHSAERRRRPAEDPRWSPWLGQFTSLETQDGYARELNEWARWLDARDRSLHEVRPADVASWMESLRRRHLAEATVARKAAAVLSYYRWARTEGLVEAVPKPEKLPKVHTDPVRRLGLPIDELSRLLNEAKPGLELALLTLMAHTGVRVSEATGADVASVKVIQGQRVLQVTGKGRKKRSPPLTDEAWPAIQAYLDGRRTGPLFVSRRGERLSRQAAWRLVKAVGRRAGGLEVYPHLFRHSAAVVMARHGYSVKQIAVALGHADIKTTSVYLEGLAALEDSPIFGLSRLLAEAQQAAR